MWYDRAFAFHEGARILGHHKGDIRVFLFNAAFSIELLLKAINAANGKATQLSHNLLDLAKDAEIPFSDNQNATLELLNEILIWKGRYPTPTKPGRWDNFYDNVLEKHIIRQRNGKVGITRTNPTTVPTIENFEVLWDIANQKWSEIQTDKYKIE